MGGWLASSPPLSDTPLGGSLGKWKAELWRQTQASCTNQLCGPGQGTACSEPALPQCKRGPTPTTGSLIRKCMCGAQSAGSGDPQVTQSQPGPPLGSPEGAQLHTVSRGLAGFPLQRLLDELPEQLGARAGLVPHGRLQPSQPCQALALHLAVPGLEVGTLWRWGQGGGWPGHLVGLGPPQRPEHSD